MSRTVFCQRLKKEAPGLDFQLYPGELGKRIFDNISREAWAEWQKKQVMLINEKKLNMMNLEHRQLLEKEMVSYLFEAGEVQIEGYTLPASKQLSCSTCEWGVGPKVAILPLLTRGI